jgi:hypothetical protein
MAQTRSDIIATLRSRNVKGRLTKMTKANLLRLLNETAPPTSSPRDVQRQGIHLAPDPEDNGDREQSGGHYFQSFGKASASQNAKYKHTHKEDSMPTTNKGASKTQTGKGHTYRDFIAAEMRTNGGNMKAAVAKWRAHKGSGEQAGGHMVRADGTISDKEDAKYKHTHKNLPNPATGRKTKAPEVVKPADATPTKPTTRAKAKPRGDESIFDNPAPSPRPKAKVVDKRAATAAKRTAEAEAAEAEASKPRTRKAADPVVAAARKRLKADQYTSKYRGGLAEYKRIEDQLTVSNKSKPTRDQVRDTQKLRKGLRASKADRDEGARNDRANESLQSARSFADKDTGEPVPRRSERHKGGSRESDERDAARVAAQARGPRHAQAHHLRDRMQLLSRYDHMWGDEDGALRTTPGDWTGMAAPSEPGAAVVGVAPEGAMLMRRRLGSLERMIDVDDDPGLSALDDSSVQQQLGSGAGPGVDLSDPPDGMTDEQIADVLVDQGIDRISTQPDEARRDFEAALQLDPGYTLAREYLDTLDQQGRLQDAKRRLLAAQVDGLDMETAKKVGEQLGRGHFWHDVWQDTKTVGEGLGILAAGIATGGAADALLGGAGVIGEAASGWFGAVADNAATDASAAASRAIANETVTGNVLSAASRFGAGASELAGQAGDIASEAYAKTSDLPGDAETWTGSSRVASADATGADTGGARASANAAPRSSLPDNPVTAGTPDVGGPQGASSAVRYSGSTNADDVAWPDDDRPAPRRPTPRDGGDAGRDDGQPSTPRRRAQQLEPLEDTRAARSNDAYQDADRDMNDPLSVIRRNARRLDNARANMQLPGDAADIPSLDDVGSQAVRDARATIPRGAVSDSDAVRNDAAGVDDDTASVQSTGDDPPVPEPEPQPERGRQNVPESNPRGTQGGGDEGPGYRARDMYNYGNEPGLLRRAAKTAYERGSSTINEIKTKSKAELIKDVSKFAAGSKILEGAVEDPFKQAEGDHSAGESDQQQAADKKRAAEALQDRLLAKQKAMMDARANDQGVMQMYADNTQTFNPMLHGHR